MIESASIAIGSIAAPPTSAGGTLDVDISAKIDELRAKRVGNWAWLNYMDTVRELIAAIDAHSVIEIGGGRAPSLTQEEVKTKGLDYTANDISARELSLAPNWVNKALFDVQTADATSIEPFHDFYDLAFSKMVMEHVTDFERAYTNLYSILRPGGISIAFHPVLYCAPFVINRMMPEALSTQLLKMIFPNRTDEGIPKFPAVYSGCRISSGVRDTIGEIGFREVWQIPFYGHNYYSRFPGIRWVHGKITEIIMDREIAPFASFAYTIVRK